MERITAKHKICYTIRNYILQQQFHKLNKFDLCEKRLSYEEFQDKLKTISNPEHKCSIIISKIISLCNSKLNIKKFLTLFLFVHYSDNILGISSTTIKRTKLENALIKHSILIKKYIFHPSLNQTVMDTNKLLNQFSILLSYWLHTDKKKQIEELCDIYYNLPKSFSFTEKLKKQNLKSFEKQKKEFRLNIRNHILQICGPTGIQLLHEYGQKMKKIEDKMKQEVTNVMHDTYWKIFKTSLEESPPNYSQVINCLNEIREKFLYIVGTNTYWKNRINENLEISYIRRRINNSTFDSNYLKSLIIFIFNGIQELGAPVNDKGLKECKNQMLLLMESSKSYSDFLPVLFRNIMERINHLHQSVMLIKNIN